MGFEPIVCTRVTARDFIDFDLTNLFRKGMNVLGLRNTLTKFTLVLTYRNVSRRSPTRHSRGIYFGGAEGIRTLIILRDREVF